MASASSVTRLCLSASRRILTRPLTRRAFGSSTTMQKKLAKADEEFVHPRDMEFPKLKQSIAEATSTEGLEALDTIAKEAGYSTIEEAFEKDLFKGGFAAQERAAIEAADDVGKKVNSSSFWHDPEDPEPQIDVGDEFNEDDITSMAHGKLDEIREMRDFERKAVWELPLLSKYAKPFEPPTEKQVLRWRYTSYMGEQHPAEKKVVVQFAPDDLNLTAVQTEKLKKLVGPRYNPETEIVRMSCESFEHQAQNKRYLSNLVDDLIAAAKDPKDTFEDIPLDTRHHQIKKKPKFPKEWYLTEERKKELDSVRQALALEDLKREEQGQLVSGAQKIESYLLEKIAEEQKLQLPEMATVPASRGDGGRRSRR